MSKTKSEGNYTLNFKRNHPQDRASYGIAGNPGIVVFPRDFFLGATAPVDNSDLAGLPAVITLDVELVAPKAAKEDAKLAKEAAVAAKVIEKAAKDKEKLEAAQVKAIEKKAKAEKVLAAARAKVEAATAKKDEEAVA